MSRLILYLVVQALPYLGKTLVEERTGVEELSTISLAVDVDETETSPGHALIHELITKCETNKLHCTYIVDLGQVCPETGSICGKEGKGFIHWLAKNKAEIHPATPPHGPHRYVACSNVPGADFKVGGVNVKAADECIEVGESVDFRDPASDSTSESDSCEDGDSKHETYDDKRGGCGCKNGKNCNGNCNKPGGCNEKGGCEGCKKGGCKNCNGRCCKGEHKKIPKREGFLSSREIITDAIQEAHLPIQEEHSPIQKEILPSIISTSEQTEDTITDSTMITDSQKKSSEIQDQNTAGSKNDQEDMI